MLRHGALDNRITHIQIVEIVTRITQGDTLEIGYSWSLIREELIFQTFGSEALVGVDGQRLELIASCSTAHDACFAKLIETAGLVLSLEILELNGAAPVVFIVLLPALVGTIYIDTDLGIVQVLVVGADGNDGKGHLSGMEDEGMSSGAWRQPSLAEDLCPDNPCLGNRDGIHVWCAVDGRFTTVGSIADGGSIRAASGQGKSQ